MKLTFTAFITLLLFFMAFFVYPVFGEFRGPAVVLEGKWGNGTADFSKGTDDDPAFLFLRVDEADNIIIGDEGNSRIKIYNSKGVWQKNISPKGINPIGGWPPNLEVKSGVGIFAIYGKMQKYDYNGNLIWVTDVPGSGNFWVADDGGIWLQGIQPNFYKYSSSGQLEKAYTSRPIELGIIKESEQPNKSYKVNVQYPNAIYSIVTPGQRPDSLIKDSSGNLYVVQRIVKKLHTIPKEFKQHYRVIRYDSSSKEVKRIDLPEDVGKVIGHDNTVGTIRQSLAAYHEPLISPRGDIYVPKSTPSTYSILKWVWVDESRNSQMTH